MVLKSLSRNIIFEIACGIAILLIVGYLGVTAPARHIQPDWPFSFRWDWSVLEKAPKARAEFDHALIWAAIGMIALISAILRKRRRGVVALIAVAALGYAIHTADTIVSIDAYPTTYKRPAVTYQAISIANGSALYQDSGCIACHGPSGYGDGPVGARATAQTRRSHGAACQRAYSGRSLLVVELWRETVIGNARISAQA